MNAHFITILFILTCISAGIKSQNRTEISIIPKPKEVALTGEQIHLNGSLYIFLDPSSDLDKLYVSSVFHELGLKTYFTGKKEANLIVTLDKNASGNPEGYLLTVENSKRNQIIAKAPAKAGLLYALQSLRQIISHDNSSFIIPVCTIYDEPAFAWRAFMLDESRHFHGEHVVKGLLDEMARLKLNIFHWHLVDDPGWRIEIKKNDYPQLFLKNLAGKSYK